MQYSDTELRALVARAMPLSQRWHGGVEACGGASQAASRLQAWQQALSGEGDAESLARRLACDRLDVQTCVPWLGAVRLADHAPLPEWAERFNAVLLRSCSSADRLPPWALSIAAAAEQVLPFWDVWVPFVTCSTEDLRRRAGETLHHLTEAVLGSFQWQLLSTLVSVAALPLSLEFRRFLARRDPLSVFNHTPTSTPSRALYGQFVSHLRAGGLFTFFQAYAPLARLMTAVAGHWAEHVAEFCQRLDADRAALAQRFHQGTDLGQVVHIRLGLSDPHHGRRDVLIPTFACGVSIVYKPKDLGVDEAWWAFIEWLNTRAPHHGLLPLRTLTVLNRSTHGWVECVSHQACQKPEEVLRYYRRLGMLLCLAYVLGATDCHQDNIIASGEQPVLLDLETLLQPLPPAWDGLRADSADQRAVEILHTSVLRTGLLPFWIMGNAGKSYDVSGIAAEPSDTGYLNAQWDNINTDRMQLVYRSIQTEPQANRPMLNAAPVSAEDHGAEIGSGFTAMYRALLAHREVLLGATSPLQRFRGVRLRYLVRMTKAYGQILNRRLYPAFLRDGADGGIELERLARDFVSLPPDPAHPPPWGIYRAEVEALERLDVPFFSFVSDADALCADGRVVAPGFFAATGLQRLYAALRQMSEADLQAQTDFIRASLHTRYTPGPSSSASVSAGEGRAAERLQAPLPPGELVAAAVAIAEQLRQAAIRGADGSVTWLSLAFDPTVERTNLLPMADNLYDGRLGVAFFLAALEHLAGGSGWRDLALAAVLPLRQALRQRIPPLLGRTALGGAAGLGSQLYALVRIAGWLGDEELWHLAADAAARLIPPRIAGDEALDVFGGAAGGLLGLLALSAVDGSGAALDLAAQCGRHLLDKRVRAATGHLVWPGSWASRPLTGFSHGAAGIAYALLRLHRASGEPRFRAAAEEGIAYETAVYSASARNWPDFRLPAGPEGDHFMVAWCHGAPGIGLGRLGGLPVLDTPAVRQDIAQALDTTRSAALTDEDHLCCGNLGRLDLLTEASRRLGRPELLDEARRRASALVRRAVRQGGYGLFAQVPGVTNSFSLFQGTAGIGYEMLRLAAPDRMPCVLLWE